MSGGSKKSVPDIPTESTFLGDPIAYYKTRTGVYPNNSEIWWSFRRPIEIGTDSSPKSYLEVFDPSLRHQIQGGNTPAPRGHYILKAFHQDRSSVSSVPSIPVQSAGAYRPTCTAFYAGRVFYAGVNVSGFNTKVYFSQILERPDQVQQCYQMADPTSEDIRDLLPSDGGVLVIPEITEVYHMQVMGQSLFLFARNGVWQIAGGQSFGFAANDYSIKKVSGTPAISPLSFVSVEGSPMWWNKAGIYTLILDQMGGASVKSLTEETIKSFFDDIPNESKFYAKGAYDPLTQRVQWIYASEAPSNISDRYNYDRILVFDARTGAFFPYSPAESDRVNIKGIFCVEGFETLDVLNEVVVDGDPVEVEGDAIGTTTEISQPIQSKIKYIVNILAENV